MGKKVGEIIKYYEINWLNRISKIDKKIAPNFHYGIIRHTSVEDPVLNDHMAKEEINKLLAKKLKFKKLSKVLDAGCGIGATVSFLAKNTKGLEIHALNIDVNQIKLGKKLFKNKKIKWKVADFCNLPYGDGYFDAVYGIESVCHASNKDKFFKEARRVLKVGGRMVLFDNFLINKASK